MSNHIIMLQLCNINNVINWGLWRDWQGTRHADNYVDPSWCEGSNILLMQVIDDEICVPIQDGKPVPLRFVNFQNVSKLTVWLRCHLNHCSNINNKMGYIAVVCEGQSRRSRDDANSKHSLLWHSHRDNQDWGVVRRQWSLEKWCSTNSLHPFSSFIVILSNKNKWNTDTALVKLAFLLLSLFVLYPCLAMSLNPFPTKKPRQ